MLKKILLGPLKGGIIGALLAVAIVGGLGVSLLTGGFSYLAAVAVGFLTGVLAGKPVWARSAKTEALIKALAGGCMAAALLFVLRRFVTVSVNLGPLGAGKLLELPLVVLAALGAVLALLFEIDDAVGRAHDTPHRPN